MIGPFLLHTTMIKNCSKKTHTKFCFIDNSVPLEACQTSIYLSLVYNYYKGVSYMAKCFRKSENSVPEAMK